MDDEKSDFGESILGESVNILRVEFHHSSRISKLYACTWTTAAPRTAFDMDRPILRVQNFCLAASSFCSFVTAFDIPAARSRKARSLRGRARLPLAW